MDIYKYRISALPRSPLELSLQLQGPLRPAQGDVGHQVMLSSSPASPADSGPPPARSTPSSTWTALLKATQRKTACFATWAGLVCRESSLKSKRRSVLLWRLGKPEGVRWELPRSVCQFLFVLNLKQASRTVYGQQRLGRCQRCAKPRARDVPNRQRIPSHIHKYFVLACLVWRSQDKEMNTLWTLW